MQKNDYQKLRECPFCGGEAKMVELNFCGKKIYHIDCTKVGRHVEVSFPFRSKEEAIEVWNTRKGVEE